MWYSANKFILVEWGDEKCINGRKSSLKFNVFVQSLSGDVSFTYGILSFALLIGRAIFFSQCNFVHRSPDWLALE